MNKYVAKFNNNTKETWIRELNSNAYEGLENHSEKIN